MNLYEYRIPESDYQSNICGIHTELARPDVLGAYELQVPLMLRLLIELGCVWSVSKKVSSLVCVVTEGLADAMHGGNLL